MFSVIIPTYNRQEMLKETIESVLKQTLEPDEIIIVNNGDVRLDSCLFGSNKNIIVVNTVVRAGVSQARNIGATLARGEWIAFLDDDDFWEEEYLEKASNFINANDTDCLIARKDYLLKEGVRPHKDYAKHKGNMSQVQNSV